MAVLRLPAWSQAGDSVLDSAVVAGRRIHYVTQGAGEPLVLIHGLGGSWRWWCNNIGPLAQHYRVYALDLGRRDQWLHGRTRVRPAEAADVLTEWLAHLGLEQAHLVGHSLGGQMSIRLTAAHPARVGRLVLVNAAGLPLGTGLLGLTRRAIGPAPERTSEFRRLVLTDSLRTNPLVVWQTARDLVREDVSDLLSRIVTPTLIIWGGRDHVVPFANALALQAGIPGARLHLLPHSGHNPMYYHADEFNRTVLDFLAEAAGQGGA